MNTLLISHWRQTAGQGSPTLMELQGKHLELSSSNTVRIARDMMSDAIRVMQEGTKHAFNHSLAVYISDEQFVIESVPVQLDQLGRESPIISFGTLPVTERGSLTGQMIVDDILRFASQHGLSFQQGQDWTELILIIDDILKKKTLSTLSRAENWKILIMASNILTLLSAFLWKEYGYIRHLVVFIASLLPSAMALLIGRRKSRRTLKRNTQRKPRRKGNGDE